MASHWDLDPNVVFLNHGSFGAMPREVKAAQQRLRDRMEAEPVRFFVEEYRGLMDATRAGIASFVDCDARDIAPVPNATFGVATVVTNLVDWGALRAGDEVITNDHEYPACQNNLRRQAGRAGARVVMASIPFPLPLDAGAASDAIVDAILSKVTDRTRLALLSHVTSASGLVLPVERLVPLLSTRGIETIVDGAHAPGMLPISLRTLGPTYYTANCHKWICSPKGSAFLYVSPDRRRRAANDGHSFRPVVLSNNAELPIPGREQFLTEFDYVGTSDQTAYMSVPAAIQCMENIGIGLPGDGRTSGWERLRSHNHALAIQGRDILCRRLGIQAPAPEANLGTLATIILPPHAPEVQKRLAGRPTRYQDALQDALLDNYGIQVPVSGIPGRPMRTLRISAQAYNSPEQYQHLAEALSRELERERNLR